MHNHRFVCYGDDRVHGFRRSRWALGRNDIRFLGASMTSSATLTVAETVPKSFLLAVETRGEKPALREK